MSSLFGFSRKVKADERSDSPRHSEADGAASVGPRPAMPQSPSSLDELSPSSMKRVSKATRRKARKQSMQGNEGVVDLCSPKERPARRKRHHRKPEKPDDSIQLTEGLQAIQGSTKI